MKIISFLTDPPTLWTILLHLDLPRRPPRVSPARGPPQADFELDQSPAFDLAGPDTIPEFEFDPWKEMAGMRDKLIHAYETVDVELVLKTVRERIPEVEPRVLAVLERLKESE